MSEEGPKFEPKSFGVFSEWCVLVTWPSGYTEKVMSFRDEAHALGWIKSESAAWIDKTRGPRR